MVAQTNERRKGSKREKRRLKSPMRRTKKAITKIFSRLIVNSFLKGTLLKVGLILHEPPLQNAIQAQ